MRSKWRSLMILPRCLLLCIAHASAGWLPAHFVDAHAGTHLDVFTIELYHGLLQRLHQSIVGISSHKNVVGSDAHLPAVQKLALQAPMLHGHERVCRRATHSTPARTAQMRRATTPKSLCVLSTMQGDLPPSSSVTDVRCFAAADITMRPTAPFPVPTVCA